MKRRPSAYLILWVLAASLSLPTLISAINVGDQAPGFALDALGGGTYESDDFSGRVLVLYFFGFRCPVCYGTGPFVEREIWQAFKDRDLQVLGIEMWNGSESGVLNFSRITGTTFPLLLNGTAQTAVNRFEVNIVGQIDALMVIDQEGVIRHISTSQPEDVRRAANVITGLLGSDAILADPRADFDQSGGVDFLDFVLFAQAYDTDETAYDLDASGRVDFGDFLVFASSFGRPLN